MKQILISINPRIYDYVSDNDDELCDSDDDDDDSDDDNITEIVIIYNTDDTIIGLINKIDDGIKEVKEVENIYVFVSSESEDYDDIVSLIKSIYQNIKIITEID